MTRSRVVLTLAILLGVMVVAGVAGGLTLWAQPRALVGGSYIVSAQIDVNGTATSALLLATFTSDGKVLASDDTLFGFDPAASAACGFVDPASNASAAVRFGPSHGAWKFTSHGALWTTFAIGDVNGKRVLRRARGIGQEFFASHGGPVVIDFFNASDRTFASPLCTFHGRWAAARIEPTAADFGQ